MTKDKTVIFKGGKDGIIIQMDENADFHQIFEALRLKTKEAAKFFADADTSIIFKGKKLEEGQIAELLEVINEESKLNVTFVEDMTGKAEPAAQPLQSPPPSPEGDTYFHMGSLRSGQTIKFDGSVVLMGDVNPGAEVIADGNIVILGALKGMAHAGANGNTACFVSALAFRPTQLRIAHIIATVKKPEKGDAVKASVAYANQDGKILIGDL